jgi:hypothetical protein
MTCTWIESKARAVLRHWTVAAVPAAMMSVVAAGVSHCFAAGVFASGERANAPRPAASDWCLVGMDCTVFAAADLDADRRAEVLTINSNRDLCAVWNVSGWKAAGWIVVRSEMPSDANGLLVTEIDSSSAGPEALVLTPGSLVVLSRFEGEKYQNEPRVIDGPSDVPMSLIERTVDGVFITDAAGTVWRFDGKAIAAAPGAKGSARGDAVASDGADIAADPPPYNTDAVVHARFTGDLNADGIADHFAVFDAKRPYEHRAVRVALTPNPSSDDQDSDGLTDAQEAEIGSNPLDRDTDMDGLLDGWEVNGLPRGIPLGSRIRTLRTFIEQSNAPIETAGAANGSIGDVTAPPPASQAWTTGGRAPDDVLSPLRQDVILSLSYFEGVDPAQMEGELPRVQGLYRAMGNPNPDGSSGVWVHFRVEPVMVAKADQTMPWWDVGNKYFPQRERGFMHWLQITPWGGGQSGQTADMGGAGNNWAVIAHEFGHQLSLSHEGDSPIPWCPLYPSLMSYAFSYSFDGDGNAIKFSTGEFRETVLDERRLSERLPYRYERVKYLANWPFRFTLKDDGGPDGAGGTLIDWNHNGVFDQEPVEADVNYGGSTNCGIRRNQEQTGSGPALAYVAGVCYLAASDLTRDGVWIKAYQGDEKWSEKRVVTNSASEEDPILVGGAEYGLLFHHHQYGWHVTRLDAKEVGTPARIPDLPVKPMNACRVGDRVLIVTRNEDDTLEYRWLTFKENDFNKPTVTTMSKLETRSLVTPGLAVDPSDGRLLIVTSMHNSRGGIYGMRVTWAALQGDRLWEQELKWTRGEGSGNGCCSKPVVAFTPGGQLNIFHQGGPDAAGRMIAYRTSRLASAALDEGWLTCMLYDVWTSSRVPVAFAAGPQGAIYSYRWDAGGTNAMLQTCHNGFGIDTQAMRDFNDGEQVSRWGIRHSKLYLARVP